MVLLDALIWQRSGIFFLGQWAEPPQVAYYALAFGLAQMLMRAVPGALVGLLIPSMARAVGSGRLYEVADLYRASGRWMALLALPLAIMAAGGGAALIHVLYGPKYAPVTEPLIILLFSGAATMVWGFPASSVLYALDGQHRLLAVGVFAAGVYVALAAWLIPTGGAVGAAWATAGAQLFTLAPGVYFARRALNGVSPDWRALAGAGIATAWLGFSWVAAQWLFPGVWGSFGGLVVGLLGFCYAVWHLQVLTVSERQRLAQTLKEQVLIKPVTGVTPWAGPRV
jgi:O-antigen/teichoic acid export membrane protein